MMKNLVRLLILLFTTVCASNLHGQLNTSLLSDRLNFNDGTTAEANFRYDGASLTLETTESTGNISLHAMDNVILISNDDLLFRTGGNNTRMFIGNGGNVGIGTTSPQTKLHLTGNAELLNLEGNDHAYMQFFPRGFGNGRKGYLGFGSSTNNDFDIVNESNTGDSDINLTSEDDIFITAKGDDIELNAEDVVRLVPGDDSGLASPPAMSLTVNRTYANAGGFPIHTILLNPNGMSPGSAFASLGSSTNRWDYLYSVNANIDVLNTDRLNINKNSSLSNPHTELHEPNDTDFSRIIFTNTSASYYAMQVAPTTNLPRYAITYNDGNTQFNAFTILEGKALGILDNTPDYTLDVNGTAGKPGGGDWSNASDRRLKKDIEDFKDGLEQILQIRPVWYRYNGKFGLPTEERYVGVIAQEIQDVAPYTVTPYQQIDEKTGEQGEFLSYNGTAVTYMLVNAVQEQQGLITELEAKTQKVDELEERLAKLEALFNRSTAISETQTDVHIQGKNQARLEQNAPNPFNENTVIEYYLPEGTTDAYLRIANQMGKVLKLIKLETTGQGQVNLTTDELPSGTYSYSLLLDGKTLETKQMILAN